MEHIKYPKIMSIHKEEVKGILSNNSIYIQEKIDGANLSIWMNDGHIFIGSRTQIVGDENRKTGFNGAVEYCNTHKGIKKLLIDNPGYRLFGEWLVKHSIEYPPHLYNKFYMFDIMDEKGEFIDMKDMYDLSEKYCIDTPHLHRYSEEPISIDTVKEYAEMKVYGPNTEGVVIKSKSFVNEFGDHCYAKFVTENFKEKNSIVFGVSNKNMEIETQLCMKYCTAGRFIKIVNKLEQNSGNRFDYPLIGRIIKSLYHDIITEECTEICKGIIDFTKLNKVISNRTRVMCLQYLEGDKSLFYTKYQDA